MLPTATSSGVWGSPSTLNTFAFPGKLPAFTTGYMEKKTSSQLFELGFPPKFKKIFDFQSFEVSELNNKNYGLALSNFYENKPIPD